MPDPGVFHKGASKYLINIIWVVRISAIEGAARMYFLKNVLFEIENRLLISNRWPVSLLPE